MDLNFINKDFKNYLKGISKDMRRQVLRNIAEKTDIRASLKQIGDDALIPLKRLSREEIRRYESLHLSKTRNDDVNKKSKHLDLTKKYLKEPKQDNSVSSTTSVVKDHYKCNKKREETFVSSSNLAVNTYSNHSKKNRIEENIKSTKEFSTNKENLKLTLINLFEEENNLKIPEHKLEIPEMKASTLKKILEAKNLNKDKKSETKSPRSVMRQNIEERSSLATPVTPRKRGRPPKNPSTPSETPQPKNEERSSKSKQTVTKLWKKTVEEYNKVKRIERKRSESQITSQGSSSDLQRSSSKDRSRSSSPVVFRRHFVSDSSKQLDSSESSESIDSIDRFSPDASLKRRKSTCAEISSTSSNIKTPSSISSDKTKRRKSICTDRSSDRSKTPTTSKVSSEDSKHKRKSSDKCNIIDPERKTQSILRQSSNLSTESNNPKRRKSLSKDRTPQECGTVETAQKKVKNMQQPSDTDKTQRRKSACEEKSSKTSTTTEPKRRKSVCAEKCSKDHKVIETGPKTISIVRQSSNESSGSEKPKRRKSSCAEKSAKDCNITESGRKTPCIVRQSSEDRKPQRRKSLCAEKSAKDLNTTDSGRKAPEIVCQSSEDNKTIKRKSVSADRSSKDCDTGRKTPYIVRQSSDSDKVERRKSVCGDRSSQIIESGQKPSCLSSNCDKLKKIKSVSSKDVFNILTEKKTSSSNQPKRRKSISEDRSSNKSTKTETVQKTPSKKLNRSKSICVDRSSEDISSPSILKTCKTPSNPSSNKLKRRKSVSIDSSSFLLTPNRETSPKRQKSEDISSTTNSQNKEVSSTSQERSKEEIPVTPTRNTEFEAVKRRIFSDSTPKYTIPKRRPSVIEDTSIQLERTSVFEDSVEEELEQIFKSTEDLSRGKKRSVTPKLNDSFINYGDLVQQMKTTPSTKKSIDFLAPLATSSKEFSKPSYSADDMTYDSVLVVDENRPNKILIRRRSVQDIQATTSRTVSRRHSFHFEEPLKIESDEEWNILGTPQRIFKRRKSVHELNIPDDLTIKRSNSEDPSEDLIEDQITVDDQKIDIQNIDIEKLFPTDSNEDVITLEVSSDENSPSREELDDFKDVKHLLKDIEVGLKAMEPSSEDVKDPFIEVSSESSDNSSDTFLPKENEENVCVNVSPSSDKVQTLTTDESVLAMKNYFVSLLYIYDQYYKMTDRVESQIILGLNPSIGLQKKYFNKRHDSDLAKLYQKLTEIRVSRFSLIVFFDKLTKVLKEEFKKYKEISELVIVNYLRRVAWILMENFTSPSDEKSLFNCITSFTSVEYLMSYKKYCNSNMTELDKKMIKIFNEICYKNEDKSAKKDTNSNIVQPKDNLSLPIINAKDKSPVKPKPPKTRKYHPPKNVAASLVDKPATKPVVARKSPLLNLDSIDKRKTYLSSSHTNINNDLSKVLLELNKSTNNENSTEVPQLAEVTRKSLTSIEVTLKPQMVPKPRPQNQENNKITILDVQVTRPENVPTQYLKLVDQNSLKKAQPIKDLNQNYNTNYNNNTGGTVSEQAQIESNVSQVMQYLIPKNKTSNQRVITADGTIVEKEIVEPEKAPKQFEPNILRKKRPYKKRTPPVKDTMDEPPSGQIPQNIKPLPVLLPIATNSIQITICPATAPVVTISETITRPQTKTNVQNIGHVIQPMSGPNVPQIRRETNITQPIPIARPQIKLAQFPKEKNIGQAAQQTMPQILRNEAQKSIEHVSQPLSTISQTMARPTGPQIQVASLLKETRQVTKPLSTISQTMAQPIGPQIQRASLLKETNVSQSIGQVSQPLSTISQTMARPLGPQIQMASLLKEKNVSQSTQVTQPRLTRPQTQIGLAQPISRPNETNFGRIPQNISGMGPKPVPHPSERNIVPSHAQTVTHLPENMPQYLVQPSAAIPQRIPGPHNVKERVDQQRMPVNMEQPPQNIVQYPNRLPGYMAPSRHEYGAQHDPRTIPAVDHARMAQVGPQNLVQYPNRLPSYMEHQNSLQKMSDFCYNYDREAYNRMAQTQYNYYRERHPNNYQQMTSFNSNITNNYTFNNHLNYQVPEMLPRPYLPYNVPYQRPTTDYYHQSLPTARRPATKSAPKGPAIPSSTSVQQPMNLNTITLSPNTNQHLPESLQGLRAEKAPQSKSTPQEKPPGDFAEDIHNRLALRNVSRDSGYLSPSDINLQQPDNDVICERCLEPSNLMCSGCLTFYCSRICQQLAWPDHEKKCYTFSQNG